MADEQNPIPESGVTPHGKAISIRAALLIAALEAVGFITFEIGEGLEGRLAVFVHCISLCCAAAGFFVVWHEKAQGKKTVIWIIYGVTCVVLAFISYLIWYHPIQKIPIPPPPIQTNQPAWLPPELPEGCTNIRVFFGNQGIEYSLLAEQTAEDGGKKFPIKDLAPFFTKDIDKDPHYNRLNRSMWLRLMTQINIGNKSFSSPVTPHIENNRLYVEVQLPFSNQRKKLVMDDDFDADLAIPRFWDRNYNTNVFIYEVVNELTNPVLQIIYTAPNEIHVNGIFQEGDSIYESFGGPPTLLTITAKFIGYYPHQTNQISDPVVNTISLNADKFNEQVTFCLTDSPAILGELLTNEMYRPTFPGQRAFFKYPSVLYPGAFADWVTVIQTSQGTFAVNQTNRAELDPLPESLGTKTASRIGFGIIIAGILWMCTGWIFFQKKVSRCHP